MRAGLLAVILLFPLGITLYSQSGYALSGLSLRWTERQCLEFP